MNKLFSLIKRNIKIYFSHKSNIFFSSLALIILVTLHFLVFRSQNADALLEIGMNIDDKWAYWFSDSLMLSSLIPISGITIALTSMSQIVSDKETGIINDLYISPINKNTLLFSYILSSIIISLFLLTIYLLFLVGYYFIVYELIFGVTQFLLIMGISLLSVLLGNFFVLIIISFIKREQALGAVGTILGTLMGFLCGAYVPIGLLGDSIVKIFTLLPFLPITSLAREVFFMNIDSTGIPSEIISGDLAEIYGYELFINDKLLSNMNVLGIIIIYIILFIIINILRFKKMKNRE